MKQKWLNFFIAIFLLFSSVNTPIYTHVVPEQQPTHYNLTGSYAVGHVIVRLYPEALVDSGSLTTHVASLDHILVELHALALVPIFGLSRTYRLDLNNDADITQAVAMLRGDPAVEYAEPDYLARLTSAPNDPHYVDQWGLSKIQIEGAWSQTQGSPSIVIAVIDSGIDLTHPDLMPNLWVNPGEIASNGIDDDNNSLIDDIQGWNFVDDSNNVQDGVGHGSLVAGVAAARINNGIGIAGVCGLCQIMPVKVSQSSGLANYSDIAAGINYAVDKGARVINLSVGGYSNSQAVHDAVNHALSHNVVVVGGAGNDNKSDLFYPAAYEGVIGVSGTDSADIHVGSSNYGSWVDLSAPGQNVLSTTLGDYSSDTGTSYAAPFVAGTAGILLSLHPEWTPSMIRAQVMHTADTIDSQNPGFLGQLGAGRLNVSSSMEPAHPILNYQSYSGNGITNLRPDFNSTVSMNVTIGNDWADAMGVSGILTSTDPHVTVTAATATFGNVLSGQSIANPITFKFTINSAAGYNHPMPFSLALSANGGTYNRVIGFSIITRSSEEIISGTIDTNLQWTNDKIYKITGNVGIAPSVSLTIQPGTLIKFAGNYSLNIGGALIALGSAEQPIRFEPYSAGVSWNQILFDDSSMDAQSNGDGIYQGGNLLRYVIASGSAGGIVCSNATPYLDHLTISGGGINCGLGSTPLWLLDSTLVGTVNITQGAGGLANLVRDQVSADSVTLPASKVMNSIFNGVLTIQGNGQVSGTTVKSMTVNGVGNVQEVNSSGNIAITSGQVLKSTVSGGSISASSNVIISDCVVSKGGISAGPNSTVSHNRVDDSPSNSITIGATGTISYNRVVNSVGIGIIANSGVVENNLIANTSGNGLQVASASIRNNTFTGIKGTAIYLTEVPIAFDQNNFEFNPGTYDVFVNVPQTQAVTLNAQNNWWGTTDNTSIKTRIWDFYDGDYNLAKLDTSSNLNGPSQTAPGYVRAVTLNPLSPVGIEKVEFSVAFSRPINSAYIPRVNFVSPNADTWKTRTSMPTLQAEVGVAVSNGKIFAIGGFDGNVVLNTVEEFDPVTNIWRARANMPTPRRGLGVAVVNNKIYAIGGYSGHPTSPATVVLSTVEEFDPVANTWKTRANLPKPLYEPGVASVNGKVYVFGGYDGNNSIYSVEEYDPVTDKWQNRANMPSYRYGLRAVSVNGKIMAIGGYDDNSRAVEEFDPVTNTWVIRASMLSGHASFGIAILNGKIYVIGGYCGSSLCKLEEFDPATNIWTYRASLPGQVVFGAAMVNDKIYAMLGGSSFGSSTMIMEYTPDGWGAHEASANQEWVTPSLFHTSYEYSVVIPRGQYFPIVQSAVDTDGLKIVTYTGPAFTVEYAGEISVTTPPPAPRVSAWSNGSLTQLSAHAFANIPGSTITGYRYSIGTTRSGTDVVNWTNTASSDINRTGLQLQPGQIYYVSIMVCNQGGLWRQRLPGWGK